MPNTKIINVQKGDTFDEIFDLFQSSDAQEVIFLFPKGTAFATRAAYFKALSAESLELNKKISIMSQDPAIVRLAMECDFNILEEKKPARTILTSDEKFEDDLDDKGDEEDTEENEEEEEEEPKAELASVDYEKEDEEEDEEDEDTEEDPGKRLIRDIIAPDTKSEVRVKGYKQKEEEEEPEEEEDEDIGTEDIETEEDEEEEVAHETSNRDEMLEDLYGKKRGKEKKKKGDKEDVEIAKLWSEEEKRQKSEGLINGEYGKSKKLKLFSGFFGKIFSKTPLIILLIAIVLLVAILYFTFHKATVIMSPRQQDLNFTLNLSASNGINEIDYDFNKIPGQQFIIDKTVEGTFSVSGDQEVAQKARGTITVFNETTSEQRLVATTRFESSDGLIFRIPETVTVPAGTLVGGEIEAGTVTVTIFADKPGDNYNIEPGRFTIPGFEGTPRFDQFYATSQEAMSGGIIGLADTVTSEDYNGAEEELTQKLRDEITQEIQSTSAGLKTLDSMGITISKPETDVEIGEAIDALDMKISGTGKVIAFQEADVIKLIEQYVSDTGDLAVLADTLALTYTDPQISIEGDVLSFSVQVLGKAITNMDIEVIKNDILGMDEEEINGYFGSMEGVTSVRVVLSPKWLVHSIPDNPEDVEIRIELDS
ncbi:MAG: hypothetical protein ABH833_02935 [Parcubacteria group bacterium]